MHQVPVDSTVEIALQGKRVKGCLRRYLPHRAQGALKQDQVSQGGCGQLLSASVQGEMEDCQGSPVIGGKNVEALPNDGDVAGSEG
jgi:hypothetical protein